MPRVRINIQGSVGEGGLLFPSSLQEPRYSQSLGRGLGILERFSPRERVLGVSELADRLGMTRSTTHRYVVTLEKLGFLVQMSGRKYRPTLG